MGNENAILQQLQKTWMIESLDFHVKGYWELDSSGKGFDLRSLQWQPVAKQTSSETPYLTTRNNLHVIQFEQNSFYEIERIDEAQLVMTYYVVMATAKREEMIRVFTIRLKMQPTTP
jgi:hypothetical protein